MKYRKGSKVEVLNTREVPCGSWWLAEIISGNGHYYNVIYDQCPPDMSTDVVDRVPRRVIRPCPPRQPYRAWVPGDIVEAFHNGSWKLSEVWRVSARDEYVVRVLGSSQAFKAHHLNLRLCQSWQDNKWVVRIEDSDKYDSIRLPGTMLHKKSNLQVLESREEIKNRIPNASAANYSNHLQPYIFPLGTKKRRLRTDGDILAPTSKKLRTCSSGAKRRKPVAGFFQEKVDAVVSPQKLLGESYMHTSYNARTGYSGMDTDWEKKNSVAGLNTRFDHYYEENDACSNCSSSGSNNSVIEYHPLAIPSIYVDELSGDAYSICQPRSGVNQSTSQQVDVAAEIHKVELQAYHTTMEAFYASGPLSWEQEELISNLRLMLHITNDEHLLELKHLKSCCSSIHT